MHGAAAPLELGDRAAARANHFQRAQNALAVCRTQPVSHQRIEPGKFAHAAPRRPPSPAGSAILPVWPGNGRHVGQAAGESAKIKSGATDNNRDRSARADAGYGLGRLFEPDARGVDRSRRHMAIKMMRDLVEIFRPGPRGQAIEHAIDLHGIGVDDLAAQLAARSRAPGRTCRWRSARLSEPPRHSCSSAPGVFPSWLSLPRLSPIRQTLFSRQALGEAAFTAVDGAGLYWLADGVACDIALKNDVSADSALPG
jgi:hypothetical protein